MPERVASHPKFIENNPMILYVTNEDSKYLSNVEHLEQGTVWVTTKDRIPKPRWSCEQSCISSPQIRYKILNLLSLFEVIQPYK